MAKMRHFILALVALLFSACATSTTPPPEPTKIRDDELKLVLIKSKNIRFYDFGTLSGVDLADSSNVANISDSRDSSANEDDSIDLANVEVLDTDYDELGDSLEDSSDSTNISDLSTPDLRIELRIFKLGKVLGSFIVTKSEICYTDFNRIDDCAPKWVAARSFFGEVSYGELFEDIFQKKDIFYGRGKQVGANGAIIQIFSYGGERFYYERSKKRVYFRNLSNGVIVSIEDYIK